MYSIRNRIGREKRIPFEINAEPFYSEANMKYLDRVISNIENGKAILVEHDLIEGIETFSAKAAFSIRQTSSITEKRILRKKWE